MIPKQYSQHEHCIPVDKIDPDALFTLDKLRAAGFIAYLVGGSVRDLMLKKKPKDFDISTSARPEEIRKLFRNCILIGKRFRLAHLRFGKKIIEVSTFRMGDNADEALIKEDNVWGSPEEDVSRRDFTINGLFYDSQTQTIIDYVGGFEDIQRKYLRTIGLPYIRFKQDPVRMLRLIKFQARFDFEIDPATKLALLDCRGEIVKSSQARILEELFRMLESGASYPFFHQMCEHGLLQILLPNLFPFLTSVDGKDIFSLLQEVDSIMQEPEQLPLDRSVLLSCIIFPFLQEHFSHEMSHRLESLHLGEVQDETNRIIDRAFHPFFHIPRRLKGNMASLMTSQYRLVPYEKKKNARIRIPRIPDFHLGLDFLYLRSSIEPGLQIIWNEWNQAFLTQDSAPVKLKRKRRKPKRLSPKKDS